MKTVKIGRSSSNDIIINDVMVSSQHAVITIYESGEIKIKDLNSRNGTYVNEKRISEETIITANDSIKAANSNVDWIKYLNSIIKKGPDQGNNREINTGIKRRKTIGRDSKNDIVFPHDNVSSSHAELIEKENGEITIVDKGSTNGTYVNGKRITIQTLHPSDTVRIANQYTFNWSNVFSRKKGKPKKRLTMIGLSAIATVAVVLVSIFVIKPYMENRPWSAEKIYSTYNKSIVMVEFAYYYQVNVDGKLFYYTGISKDSQGNLRANISTNSNPKLFGGTGTGFIVSNDGKIITNRHIVAPWDYANEKERQETNFLKEYVENMLVNASLNGDLRLLSKVGKVTIEGKMYDEYFGIYLNDTYKSESSKIPCHIIKESGSEDIDIGLIQINSKTLPPGVEHIVDLTKAIVNEEDIKEGIPVYLMGFPFGESQATTSSGLEADHQEGKISQVGDQYYFRHSAASFGGASGSPIFNNKGQLIGVHHAGLSQSGAHGFGRAIKAKYAVELSK